jgi:hypothetical protein
MEEIGALFGPSAHIADQEVKKAKRLEVLHPLKLEDYDLIGI